MLVSNPSTPRCDLGAHLSVAGGLSCCFDYAHKLGVEVGQVFTKSQRRWTAAPLSEEAIADFAAAWQRSSVRTLTAHASYLINLASADAALWERSIAALVDELERAAQLGLASVVLHPGSSPQDRNWACERVAAGIAEADRYLQAAGPQVLIETMAGQGNQIGRSFDELAMILDALPDSVRERVGVCLDTCHVHAAGYGLESRAQCEDLFDAFDGVIGLERLRIIHVNDSKREAGSRVDRHAHIGEGTIHLDAFAALLADQRLAQVPKILETSPADGGYERDLAILGSLCGDASEHEHEQGE